MKWHELDSPIDLQGQPASSPLAVSPMPLEVVSSAKPPHVSLTERQHAQFIEGVLLGLQQKAAEILDGVFAFREIAPDAKEPPEAWKASMSEEEAQRKFQLARSGWWPQKDAPSGVQVAKAFAIGFMKSEAAKRAGSQSLNVQLVKFELPEEVYEMIEVDRNERR